MKGSAKTAMTGRTLGKIKMFDVVKGYGFIKFTAGEAHYHQRGLRFDVEDVKPGLSVTFEAVNTVKGWRAEDVRPAGGGR
jgi:cold shock CspA family protein